MGGTACAWHGISGVSPVSLGAAAGWGAAAAAGVSPQTTQLSQAWPAGRAIYPVLGYPLSSDIAIERALWATIPVLPQPGGVPCHGAIIPYWDRRGTADRCADGMSSGNQRLEW